MQNILIIGTLHAGITPNNELEELLVKYKPDQLLVEISQDDLDNDEIDTYPPEMIFAYTWAIKNSIKVNGFDSKINVFKEGASQEDNQKIIEKQKAIINKFSWQEFNNKEKEKLLNIEELSALIDSAKGKEREQEMLINVNSRLTKKGTILIITGASHLNFFEENIPNATFPLRNNYQTS